MAGFFNKKQQALKTMPQADSAAHTVAGTKSAQLNPKHPFVNAIKDELFADFANNKVIS